MASELTLEINGHKRYILGYYFGFHRSIQYNRPVQSVWGGEICVEMTSGSDTVFLEMLMAEREIVQTSTNGSKFATIIPTPVSGKIQFVKEDRIFRELAFQEAYVIFYREQMSSIGSKSMTTQIVISPICLEINRQIKMRKIQPSGICLGWAQFVEEAPKPIHVTPYSPPTLLVKSAIGKTEALPNEVIEYKVTSYNLSNVSDSDRKRVKWDIEVDGKRETLKERGDVIKLHILEKWEGKDIVLRPYLNSPSSDVYVKTSIRIKAVIFFVNGYWNSGNTDLSFIEPLKKAIAENTIGTQNKRAYWNNAFLNAAKEYFQRKYKDWTSKSIENSAITPIFIDGSNVWNSSGKTRFNTGWDEAELLFNTELVDEKVVNVSGNQMKKIFIVSHSMGAAHAEGMIAAWSWHGLKIERVLHFSAADNRDFQVKLPNCTYQINLMPDLVLMYKNADDAVKTNFENFWKMMKRPYLDRPDGFMIERMLPEHYIEVGNKEQATYNHYYTKSGKVWELVPFLKK